MAENETATGSCDKTLVCTWVSSWSNFTGTIKCFLIVRKRDGEREWNERERERGREWNSFNIPFLGMKKVADNATTFKAIFYNYSKLSIGGEFVTEKIENRR